MHTAQVQLDFTEGQTRSLWYWPIQSTDNFVRKDCQIWWPSIKFLTSLSGLTFSTSVSAVSAVFLRASLWSSELTYFNCHLRWSQLKFPSTLWRKARLYEFQMLKNYKAINLKSIIVEKIGDSSFNGSREEQERFLIHGFWRFEVGYMVIAALGVSVHSRSTIPHLLPGLNTKHPL